MAVLRVATQEPVEWADFGPYGPGGSNGFKIEGGGADIRRYMIAQDSVTHGSSLSYRISSLIKGTVGVNNADFEGFSMYLEGWKVTGEGDNQKHELVWQSDPNTAGRGAWFSGDIQEWRPIAYVVDVPQDQGINQIFVKAVCRFTGDLFLGTFELRAMHARRFSMGIEEQAQYAAGAWQKEPVPPSGTVWTRYLETIDTKIYKGQEIRCAQSGGLAGYVVDTTGTNYPEEVGTILKCQHATGGQSDYFFVGHVLSTGSLAQDHTAGYSGLFTARTDYKNMQMVLYAKSTSKSVQSVSQGANVIIDGFIMDIVVSDFIAASQ